jgi:hypothetical protein
LPQVLPLPPEEVIALVVSTISTYVVELMPAVLLST